MNKGNIAYSSTAINKTPLPDLLPVRLPTQGCVVGVEGAHRLERVLGGPVEFVRQPVQFVRFPETHRVSCVVSMSIFHFPDDDLLSISAAGSKEIAR